MDYCRKLYVDQGIKVLTYSGLKEIKTLYPNLYRVGLPQKTLVVELGLKDEYTDYVAKTPIVRAGGLTKRWTWKRCVREAKLVKVQFSHLPPAAWFQANGHGSLVQAVYYLGYSWEMLRQEVGDFENSSFVESRNGLRWRSHPEASLSNFLYARGITHKRGEKYPDDYSDFSTANYAYYDLHFVNEEGEWINVEIWGDKPHGHGELRYAEKRKDKENYHYGREDFLGINFQDCFSDQVLSEVLRPYIGRVEPFQFDKKSDEHIESSHWSNADELLTACRKLAAQMPDGKFPTEEWLRKRGKWAGRDGDSFNTMSVYIKLWLGGIRNLRKLLGQSENSTEVWDKQKAIDSYKSFYQKHGITTDQYRHLGKSGSKEVDADVVREATNIGHAVIKYAGGTSDVNKLLGIEVDRIRKWTREAIIDGYRKIIDGWGVSPSQLLGDYRSSKIELEESYAAEVKRLIGATSGQFPGGAREVYAVLNFKPPSRPRSRRRRV